MRPAPAPRMLFNGKGVHLLVMDWSLIGIELLRAHAEDSAGQLDEIRERAHTDDAS
jgi:hypothetical protein